MAKTGQDRRKYLRVSTPLSVRVIGKNNIVLPSQTKDISPLGLRFEAKEGSPEINEETELKIEIPGALSAVHANAKIIWKKKTTTENGAPFDIGCEFTKIEEDNKDTFLKYFCDLLYGHRDPAIKKGEA